jgi:hypothetical protein
VDPATRLALVTAAAGTLDAAAGLVRAETPATAPQIDPVVQHLITGVEEMLSLLIPPPPASPAAIPTTPTPARR